MRLLSFLRALFRRPRSPIATSAPTPVRDTSDAPVVEESSLGLAAAAVSEVAVEPLDQDEDEWRDEEEDDPDSGPDPFISGVETVLELPANVEALREQARAAAVSGEHKLPLSSPAGPGSLAEALNALIAEGRVEAEFIDDPVEGPYMRYRPVLREA